MEGLSVLALSLPPVAEEGLDAVEELLLPLADLDGMDLERLRQLGDGLGLLGGLQATLALKAAAWRLRLPAMRHLEMDQ